MPAEPHRSGRTDERDIPAQPGQTNQLGQSKKPDRTTQTNQPGKSKQADQQAHHRDLAEADVYPRRPRWPKLVALAVGVVYTVITVASAIGIGIGVTEVGRLGHLNLVADFGVSWFLLAAHAGTAVWGLLAPARRSATKVFGTVVFVAYLGLTAYSVPAVIAEADYLNVGWGNAVVYVLTAATGLAIAIGAAAGKPFPHRPPQESDELM